MERKKEKKINEKSKEKINSDKKNKPCLTCLRLRESSVLNAVGDEFGWR